MTGTGVSRTDADRSTIGSRLSRPAPLAMGRIHRFVVMTAVVGMWMAIGWALDLGAVAYLLVGIPLTIAFQLLIVRRPISSLWLVDARSFQLDRAGIGVALALAALPLYATAMGIAGGRILDVGYGLVGVLGAAPAAFALRAMDSTARRALVHSLLTAGVVAAVLFASDRVTRDGALGTDAAGALGAVAISLLLYIPMVFVIEEVFFRGALDTYARGTARRNDKTSAIFVSLLWGAWHLPLILTGDALVRVPITLGFHAVVGLLLTGPWRRSGNLSVPGITHAVIDAIRDGIAAA